MAVFRFDVPAFAMLASIACTGALHAAAQIDLAVTVGTDPAPGACAVVGTLAVPAGTPVNYCYRATNTGTATLHTHDLVDSAFGVVLDDEPLVLSPGQSATVTRLHTIDADTTSSALWTARTLPYDMRTSVQPGGPVYDFIDISAPGSGTALNLDDDGETNVTLPFAFTFDGASSTTLRVGNNGGILFGATSGDLDYENLALPAAGVGRAILPFWDDFDGVVGNIYYVVRGTTPQRRAIIQWERRAHYVPTQPPVPGTATFEVVLAEGSNTILFQYEDVDFGNAEWNAGASATVGLNLADGLATPFSFNQPALADSFAILFTPTAESVSDAASATVTALFAELTLDATSFAFGVPSDTVRETTLVVGNDGDLAFDWSIAETDSGCATPNDVAWLTVAPVSGTVPGHAQTAVGITIDTTGLPDGSHAATLCLTSTDPDAVNVEIPIALHSGDAIFVDDFES